ncbi:MAG: hypothetical protein GY925_14360 [Actinomycetia bacterium]|nr:hypothetical protein [Actinomycetes bacterium]
MATPETLATLAGDLAGAARLLVPGQPLDSISYSCTSGTIAIGEEVVASEIHNARPGVPVVAPIGAAFDGLRGLGCERISLLVPYVLETTEMVAAQFDAAGFTLDRIATFDLEGDPDMNRVDPRRIVEAALGRPVVTSNHALALQAARAAGVDASCAGAEAGCFGICSHCPWPLSPPDEREVDHDLGSRVGEAVHWDACARGAR